MKKINILLINLLVVFVFNSCQDEPGLKIDTNAEMGLISFQLNMPQYNSPYILKDANANLNMDTLICVQPDYGFKASVNYTTQVCFDSNFAPGTYQNLPTTYLGEKIGINTLEINKAIIALYPGATLPDPVVEKNVFVRLKAVVSTTTTNPTDTVPTVKPLYSNSITLKILPYVLPLFPYNDFANVPLVRVWYIIGLGDGKWSNSSAKIGLSTIPMSLSPGKKYNVAGDGEFIYTGFFSASRPFKLIGPELSWTANTFGMTGTTYVHNGGGNISVPADGYYTLTLNTIDYTLTIVPATAPSASYSTIGLIGEFSGWSTDIVMSPTETTNNHIWYVTYPFASDYTLNGGCRFRANTAWTTNWGAVDFPYGIGSPVGSNIPFKAGTYVIVFNDIDGSYYFVRN